MSNEHAPDSRQSVDLKWKLRKALEKNVAPRDDGKGLDFGQDVGIDGKLHLNDLSDIVGPSGTALFTDSTQENVSSKLDLMLETRFIGFAAGGVWVLGGGEGNVLLGRFSDLLATGKCTDFTNCFAFCAFKRRGEAAQTKIFLADLPDGCRLVGMFDSMNGDEGIADNAEIVLGNGSTAAATSMFAGNPLSPTGKLRKLSVAEGKTFKVKDYGDYVFYSTELNSISGIDFSEATSLNGTFDSSAITSIDVTGISVSCDLSSTSMEHDALVVFINNLATVTTAQTLTMGDEKLALLSDEEKLGATNKGWTLA